MKNTRWGSPLLSLGLACSVGICGCAYGRGGPVTDPGSTVYRHDGADYVLRNKALEVRWHEQQGQPSQLTLDNRHSDRQIVATPFTLHMSDGRALSTTNMKRLQSPGASALPVDAEASRAALHFPGQKIEEVFESAKGDVQVRWQLRMREGGAYVRERVTITAQGANAAVDRVDLLSAKSADAKVRGSVKGSPVTVNDMYMAFESPLSDSEVSQGNIRMSLKRTLPLKAGQSVTYSGVVGVARAHQMRRDFQAYLSRERAHPYRTFLHYNSWFDIGYFTPYTQDQALARIDQFGQQLVEKRGVVMDSFLFDDGWDDRSGAWHFSDDFPNGFVPLKKEAAKYGAAPGIWLSPWGGYGPPKKERVTNGRARGFETINDGLALSGPNYYQRFHDVTTQLVTQDGINQFKFDGTGNADSVVPGSDFDSDFAAAINLIGDLRQTKPDLFVNLTTGTYPSPFWLRYADSIWRGGYDTELAGVGSKRQQWLTYRDVVTYLNIVKAGPLFPLNSLMLHGIVYAQKAPHGLNADPNHDFPDEVHSYFGSGTQLQEMYITPGLLSDADWDVLADAAKWSRANADVLEDTHWAGGDPTHYQVYGWAAWSPRKSIITLRNPSNQAQTFTLNVGQALELPADAVGQFSATRRWSKNAHDGIPATIGQGHPVQIKFEPFEVMTIELSPKGASAS